MNRVQYPRINVIIIRLFAAISIQPLSFPVFGQDNPNANGFQFIPGVIVTSDRSQAYVMNAEAGIDAVDLSKGTVVWTTKEASKPLGLKGNLLISQAESSGARNKLDLVVLNVQEHGKRVVAGSMELPAGVNVSIDETLNSSFVASAQPSGRDAVVSWDHIEHPVQGLPPQTGLPPDDLEGSEMDLRVMPEAATGSKTSGALRMDLTSGTVSSLPAGTRPFAAVPSALMSVASDQRIAGVAGSQYVSADGRHVQSSERIADDAVWKKHRWTIFDRVTGERLGEIKSHVSVAPFFVADTQVIYETSPYLRRTPNGLVEEPAKIRAVDLNTGQELWSKQIRDTAFRGPYPP